MREIDRKRILVTGGAGFIGSVVGAVILLLVAGKLGGK